MSSIWDPFYSRRNRLFSACLPYRNSFDRLKIEMFCIHSTRNGFETVKKQQIHFSIASQVPTFSFDNMLFTCSLLSTTRECHAAELAWNYLQTRVPPRKIFNLFPVNIKVAFHTLFNDWDQIALHSVYTDISVRFSMIVQHAELGVF
jgi:hypothetical protein